MGLCAQAADERGRAGWNAEVERRKKEKEKRRERRNLRTAASKNKIAGICEKEG